MSGPSKVSGHFHSAKGTFKENFGRLFGINSMRTSGGSEHLAGQAELHAARTKGYARGTGSRVSGKAEEVVGVVTGDTSREMSGRAKQSKGSARQRWN